MNEAQLKAFIDMRQTHQRQLSAFWRDFERLNEELKVDDRTYKHLQAKVSSRHAFLERSIQDHERLLHPKEKPRDL